MSSGIHMAAPICFIENKPDGKLVVQEEAVEILARIRQPVVVVAIVGLYRTGKSYLLNRLAGKRKGFCLGATVQAQTKGIWMWCLPHPHRLDCTLVLLDTEGLGDVQKGNSQNDAWIFALSVLLSSTFVYNSMGTIDQNALEKLHYITELTKKIRVKSSSNNCPEDENSAEFVRFFPDFIWAVRDFTLQLEINGRPVSEDGYLEAALKLQHGDSEQIRKCNLPRLCIRKFFRSRKCFTFDRPTNKRNLPRLEELEEDELETDFLEPMACFCDHIWENSKPKAVPGGQVVTGPMFVNLAKNYIQAINSGTVPCLENAVEALAEIENSAAVREAVSRYEEQMGQRLKLPTESVEEFLGVHNECEKEASRVFLARGFGENIKKYQVELVEQLLQKKEEFCKKNEGASSDRCHAVLLDLSQELEEGIRKGSYAVPGGYQCFLDQLNKIVEKYRLVPGKGIQADKALEEFLKSKEMMATSILQTDNTLSAKEKEIEAERARVEAAKMHQQLMEQEQARLTQMIEDQKRGHDEQIQLLTKKIEEERKMLQEENERMIKHKLKEQEELLKEGFAQKARELEAEMQRLKEANATQSNAAGVISEIRKLIEPAVPLFFQYKMFSKAAGTPKESPV